MLSLSYFDHLHHGHHHHHLVLLPHLVLLSPVKIKIIYSCIFFPLKIPIIHMSINIMLFFYGIIIIMIILLILIHHRYFSLSFLSFYIYINIHFLPTVSFICTYNLHCHHYYFLLKINVYPVSTGEYFCLLVLSELSWTTALV